MIVSKLAALLRIADALDRTHGQRGRTFTCVRTDEELVIRIHGVADLTLERRAMVEKADLFEDLTGLSVRIEEAPAVQSGRRRAEPMT